MVIDRLKHLAQRLALQAAGRNPEIAAVLLIGSVAQGRPSADSDIDLAILTTGEEVPSPAYEIIEDVWVGYEFFDFRSLRSIGAAPLLDQKKLRDVARLATGQILVQKIDDLREILTRLGTARPSPDEAQDLFSTARELMTRASRITAAPDRLWLLQGLVLTLSILALNLTPMRFQKPKWVFQDLWAYGNSGLGKLAAQLFPPLRAECGLAREVYETASAIVSRAFDLVAYFGPSYAGVDDDVDADYVYRTLQDACSLINDGQWKASGLVSIWAVRLAYALVGKRAPSSDLKAEISQAGAPVGFNASTPLDLTPAALSLCLNACRLEAHRLFSLYGVLYENDTCVWPSRGQPSQ